MLSIICAILIRSANKVPLPDEYDLINKDLYPFLAFTPSALRQLVRDTITTPETYTISIRNGKADYKWVVPFPSDRFTSY